jgi:ABC-type multidrug transport system ATPase subunit
LLGPSGCGKTTILRAICARIEMDEGKIHVFNNEPGTHESGIPGPIIGYMPQASLLKIYFGVK